MKRKPIIKYPLYFILPAFAIYFVFFLLPSGAGMLFAFTDWNARNITEFNFIGLDNFREIFTNDGLTLGLYNTLYFAVFTVIFKNVFGLGLALLVSNNSLLAKYYSRGVFFLPNFLNMVIIGLVSIAILHPTGPLNAFLDFIGLGGLTRDWLNDIGISMTVVSSVEVWRTAGFHMMIYLAAIKSIPLELYEAAIVDGASYLKRLRHITLPMITQGILINLIFSIINGLRVFDQIFILTNGGPGNATQVVNTTIFRMFGRGQWGLGTAYNLVLTVFILIICAIVMGVFKKKGDGYAD